MELIHKSVTAVLCKNTIKKRRETITAARSNKGKSYVAIADHINSFNTFKDYTTGTKYDTLAEAYAAYKERVENDVRFQQYKNTLPE